MQTYKNRNSMRRKTEIIRRSDGEMSEINIKIQRIEQRLLMLQDGEYIDVKEFSKDVSSLIAEVRLQDIEKKYQKILETIRDAMTR